MLDIVDSINESVLADNHVLVSFDGQYVPKY